MQRLNLKSPFSSVTLADIEHLKIALLLPCLNEELTLAKVIQWMNVPEDPEEPWDTLKAMAQAADFLDMPDFLDRTCRRMANELKGRKPEQIRQMMDF